MITLLRHDEWIYTREEWQLAEQMVQENEEQQKEINNQNKYKHSVTFRERSQEQSAV